MGVCKLNKISIVTPVFNEEDNAEAIYEAVKKVFQDSFPTYSYEHIFIDNASSDKTVEILRDLAQKDSNVKVIVNNRNFGPVRSPFHGLMSATGDAAILMAADFQEPPRLIPDFVKKLEQGHQVVLGVKTGTTYKSWFFKVRKLYYKFLNQFSNIKLIENTTAFGIFSKKVFDQFRAIKEPYPYLRGLVSDLGFDIATIEYQQNARERGVSGANWYTLYDWAWLGITSHSKSPLRLATIIGFLLSILSFFVGIVYTIMKILYWDKFPIGTAPLLLGMFCFGSMQLFFIGVLGEYIGSIYTRLEDKPLVIERERINF